MLSYEQSIALIITALFFGTLWLLGFPLPKVHRLFGLLFRPLRIITRAMVRRKGVAWTALAWWSAVTLAACLIVLGSGHAQPLKLKLAVVLCVPPFVCWGLRYAWRRHRRCRYQLPKRRR